LSRPANSAPQVIPSALDRAAIMRRAHAIAQQARPHMLAPALMAFILLVAP